MDPAVTAPGEAWPPLPFPIGIEGMEPYAVKAFFAFHQLVDTFRHVVIRDLRAEGTQPSQVACLRLLATTDGLCQRDIAEAMGISRARVTSILQPLEKMGAVRRVRDAADRRLFRVFLTDVGQAIDREKALIREANIRNVFGDMSEEDCVELEKRLDDLTARLQRELPADGQA
jgi:DNA-binding MarR family transcriptional regulator